MPKFTKLQLAIPALIVVLAAAAGGAQIWGQRAARARVDETLASLPAGAAGHYATLSFNVFTRTLRLGNLVITANGHPALSVRSVVLHHLEGGGTPADPFRAVALRLDDVQVWREGHSMTLADVQATNVAVLAPGVPPPPGTPSWLVAPGTATVISADTASADGIADDTGATLGALSIIGYAEGRLAQLSAARFSDRQGNRIASAAANTIDLDGLDRVFDTGRYTPGAATWTAPRPLIGHAAIMGFESHDASGSGGIASLIIDGVAARPFLAAPTAAYVHTGAFARDAAEALSVASVSLAGLHFTDSQTRESGTIGTLTASGYADGALAHVALAALAYTGHAPERVSLGQFALTGLVATKLLHAPPGNSTESVIALAGNGGLQLAGLDLSALSVTAPNGAVISLGALSETMSGEAPAEGSLTLQGLSIPANITPDLAQTLGLIEVDPLVLDLADAVSFDPARGDTTIKRLVLTARGLGSVSLSGQLIGVPREPVPAEDAMAAFGRMAIGPFTLTFTNDTLVQRAIAAQARLSGKTPAEIEDQVRLAASFMAAALVPAQADAGAQVAAFMAEPKMLTITAAPAAPVPLSSFAGASLNSAQKALNLRLSAQ